MIPDPNNTASKRDDSGFTLIELLVSFTLLIIILGAVYSAFFLSYKAINGIDESLLQLREGRMALDVLGREVESALFSASNKNTVFSIEDRDIQGKQASKLSFTAFSPLAGGLSFISYRMEEKDGKRTLLKRTGIAFNKENNSEKKDRDIEIMDDIDEFIVEVKYLDKWVKTWNTATTQALPDEIRVTIAFQIKDRRMSISETVRPRIGRPA